MKVSVCIPAYQAEAYLAEAIESVLAQTLADWELVVVDDGSTDATAAVAARYGDPRVRLHRHEHNLGQARAWNTAISLARAPLVKPLPADDRLLPACLERLAATEADFAFCRRRLEGEGLSGWRERYAAVHEGFGPLDGPLDGRELFRRWVAAGLRDNWIGEPTVVLARRDLLVAAGLFNPHVRGAVDMDLWARALPAARSVAFVDEELAVLRLHGGSVTARVHGRRRVSLDRAWTLLGAERRLGWPELARLRREAEVRVLRDFVRSPRCLPSAGAYVRARTWRERARS